MMKILFYGACHVGALERILTRYTPPNTLQTAVMQNFALIKKGTPFPVESLKKYDAFVFNPLFTRAAHNTAPLVEACDRFGVQHLSIPVMEWRGYFPGMTKGRFGAKSTYQYGGLYKMALDFHSYEAFEDYIVHAHLPENAQAYAANSTVVTRRIEELGHADVRIADFVEANYQKQRMFLTPGHPARALYHDVVRQLADLLSLKLDPSFFWSSYEPQAGFKDMILPGTFRALDLQFRDGEFQRADVFSDKRVVGLREYLKLYYYGARQAVVLGATRRTHLKRKPGRLPADYTHDGSRLYCDVGDLLIAMPNGPVINAEQQMMVIAANRHPGAEGELFYAHLPHWKQYDFTPKSASTAAARPVAAARAA